ncbi:DUF4097 family beta strand repeat-containing protein [Planococcus ruber]|uniref:DUF4097 family beta strand repeat-containing protein n=1 Tax=Planococcus ruber TaxID=2027871 RepID=UPI001FEF6E7A|nr:DUF4097 family beta strand repeat-containing protein [Planococcus ruber]MCJ1907562.1 DUF4097 domain-containing protein [Planococcus ruber]
MKKNFFVSIILLITLTGCSSGEEKVITNKASTEGIEEIYINFNSTDVTILPSTTGDLETHLTVYDDGSDVEIDNSLKQLSISLDSNTARLFNLTKMPKLEIKIPDYYEDLIVLNGSSGNVFGKNLGKNKIRVNTSSGNIKLEFAKINNDVDLSTTSGNASIVLDEKEPDLHLLITTNSGRQSINLLLNEVYRNNKGLEGTLGNASNKIEINTSSGNINLN